jgi:hypothetical protein
MEEDLDLFFRLEVARVRRHREPLPVRRLGRLASSGALQRPAKLAMGSGVVRLEPNRLLMLEEGALSPRGVKVGACETDPDDRITECSSMGRAT